MRVCGVEGGDGARLSPRSHTMATMVASSSSADSRSAALMEPPDDTPAKMPAAAQRQPPRPVKTIANQWQFRPPGLVHTVSRSTRLRLPCAMSDVDWLPSACKLTQEGRHRINATCSPRRQ